MKKFLATGVLALAAAALSQQQASAWCNNSFSAGISWSHQSGGNSFMWGLWRSAQPGEPSQRSVARWPTDYQQPCCNQPMMHDPHHPPMAFDPHHAPVAVAPVYGAPAPVYGAAPAVVPAPIQGTAPAVVPAPVQAPVTPGYTAPAPTPAPANQNQTSYYYQGGTYYVPTNWYGYTR